MNALEKYEIEELEQTSVEGWTIDDIGGADWALRKISALQSQNDEIKKFADLERERIVSWETKETESNNDRISFFEMKLSEYLNKLRKDDPKARIKTPHGTVGTRKAPDKWEYSSDAVKELKKLGMTDFVRVKEEVDKAEFKKVVSVLKDGRIVNADGEIIEAVKVVPQGEKLSVKVEK
ncbi:MAG: Bacteriophage Mu Gam like protein [Enterococcus gilvus]|jgi:hypothetical protein|uniref:host-nuclease inhibitor Gam family protein n=1 Tax=Enterococcus gilvus TaxID=160453 RepID=UPI0039F4F7B5